MKTLFYIEERIMGNAIGTHYHNIRESIKNITKFLTLRIGLYVAEEPITKPLIIEGTPKLS